MKNNNVNCPLCSKTHKCVIEFMGHKKERKHKKTLCTQHKREKNLFCTESDCETPICVLCLKDNHKNHDFGDLDEVMSERCEALLVDVQSLKKKIQINENRLIAVRKEEMKSSDACIESIMEYEEQLVKKIKKKMQTMVKKVQDNKAQLEHNSQEAIDKMNDTLQMLESIEETSSGSLSHKRLKEKMEEVNNSKANLRDVLSNVKEYIHVEFEESNTPNKTLKALCGQVTNNSKKIKQCKIKVTNKKVKKKPILDEEEADDSRVELSEQHVEESTANDVQDIESEMSAQEIGDDAVTMTKTNSTRKRKTKDTPEKGNVTGSSSDGNGANNQTTPLRNKPNRKSLTNGGPTPNDRSLTTGKGTPNDGSLTGVQDTPNDGSLTGVQDTLNYIPLTRGPGNGHLPMNNTTATDRGSQGPPAKRTRWDVTPASVAIKLKSEGKYHSVINTFPYHRIAINMANL